MNTNNKILLVEDDPNFGAILKDYLALNDFDVTLAKNGLEGFEKFKKDTFNLCILDVMMPLVDGYATLEQIRKYANLTQTKVMFLSAKNKESDIEKGLALGADAYLTKPFSIKKVVDQVADLLA
jgi:DNA-binding response OmpR family regulator